MTKDDKKAILEAIKFLLDNIGQWDAGEGKEEHQSKIERILKKDD